MRWLAGDIQCNYNIRAGLQINCLVIRINICPQSIGYFHQKFNWKELFWTISDNEIDKMKKKVKIIFVDFLDILCFDLTLVLGIYVFCAFYVHSVDTLSSVLHFNWK